MSGPSSAFALLGGIRALPVVAIDAVEDAIPLADALAEGGLTAIEVTSVSYTHLTLPTNREV